MKRLITILLLLIMAGQATGIFYAKQPELKSVHDLDDKNDNESKEDEKKGKEYDLQPLSFQKKLINQVDFNLPPVVIISSPVIDHPTPPPDPAFAI